MYPLKMLQKILQIVCLDKLLGGTLFGKFDRRID